MAIYTELVLACDLSTDVSQKVANVIEWFIDSPKANPNQLPATLFYHRGLLSGGNPAIPGKAHASFEKNVYREVYELTVRVTSKNLNNDFQKFLVWISQYTITEGYVGYMCSEIAETPTLIYFEGGKVLFKKITGMENEVAPTNLSEYELI